MPWNRRDLPEDRTEPTGSGVARAKALVSVIADSAIRWRCHDCQLSIPDRTGATREALRNAQSSDCHTTFRLLRATATVTAEP